MRTFPPARAWQHICLSAILLCASALGAQEAAKPAAKSKGKARPQSAPTLAEAARFVKEAEKTLAELGEKAGRAAWVQSNFITDDTEAMAAAANEEFTAAATEFALGATRFDRLKKPYDLDRKLKLLKLALTVPAPRNAAERGELTKLTVAMESAYGKGKYCPEEATAPAGAAEAVKKDEAVAQPTATVEKPVSAEASGETDKAKSKCLSLPQIERVIATSRDPEELKRMWVGWHKVSPPYRKQYARFVELANKGAREQGYKDLGALWRSNYDMPADEFAAEMERLWQQVKPLYDSLHAYTRAQLVKKYGPTVVPPDGPIPAHLLGNMWSQEWGNIKDIAAPPASNPGYDVAELLKARKTDAVGMVKYGEGFFTSLGLRKLPKTFWERSLFTKPQDREVVCHASAWDIDAKEDVRIKMCIQVTEEDFTTIHHELGHNYYQMAYAKQPPLYQGSANDGFHEALGDAVALSITPEYLKQLGFIQTVPDTSADTGLLMRQALDKVAFLPFGFLMDQWRWKVFSGETSPADYNKSWWQLRTKYQGIAPPVERSEADFDAGAKYHIPGNTPYARYFLARVLQFQFHRALCREAGFQGPLHRCSIYGNKEAGAKLQKMMEMGISRPWPEALKEMTGEERMDATAMLDYFAPLKKWLDEQNKANNTKVGW